jgi:NodT family efflux transporter outer membrane factor (OMF) lipoprotein
MSEWPRPRSVMCGSPLSPETKIGTVPRFITAIAMSVLAISICGCTSFRDYVHNGFKVGPNYCQPEAPVAEKWIDDADIRKSGDQSTLCHWWTVFGDPKLNELVTCAYRQNLTLRQAGYRILAARATRDIVVGNIFPQQQSARGSYLRNAAAIGARSSEGFGISRYSDSWSYGFNLNWELDFWGKFRRAILSADASLDASVADYDFVLVTLLGDVASNYVTIRTTQERIDLLKANAKIQQGVLDFIAKRLKAGYKQTKLDLVQAKSTLRQTEAGIPLLEITKRQAENALCVLLGVPTVDLSKTLGSGPIPTSPPDVAIGIPADLLRRRPDVRKAERLAAAQAEQIGIAKADLYPAFSITGQLGYAAQNFPDLFKNTAFNGNVGPSFQWNLLNYGRIMGNVHLQDAKFQELVVAYQNTVLTANEEVENGLVTFLRSQRRSKLLDESVDAASQALEIVVTQYKQGAVDFNRYATIEQNKVTQQDTSAQARGQIAEGLIQVYRALGGGWEIRLQDEQDETTVVSPEKMQGQPKAKVPKSIEAASTPIPIAPAVPKEDSNEYGTEPLASNEPELVKTPAAMQEVEVPKDLVIPKESASVPAKGPALGKDAVAVKESEKLPEPLIPKELEKVKGATTLQEPAKAKESPTVAKEPSKAKEPAVSQEPTPAIRPEPVQLDEKKLIEPDARP